MLALSGLVMLYGNSVETFLGKAYPVAPGGRATLEQQAATAVATVCRARLAEVPLGLLAVARVAVFGLLDPG